MAAVEQQKQDKRRRRKPAPASAANNRAEPARGARPSGDPRYRVRRFDADRRDRELSFDEAIASRPGSRQLVWIDVLGAIEPSDMDALGKRYEFDEVTKRVLETSAGRPTLAVHGSYFHLCVAAEPGIRREPDELWLDVVAGRNVVITRHAGTLELLDQVDHRIKSDTTVGAVEGAEFVAVLLDAVVTSYFAAVDRIDDEIDEMDSRALRNHVDHDILDDLVGLRRRISWLRRTIARQRTVFASLSGPDMRQIIGPDASEDLQAVTARFDAAVGSVESSREALLGSFDVYMTRTAQRTNEIVKVLTIATVLLLPGSVIAGLLGMNVVVPLNKDDPLSFWLVVAGVAALAIVVIALARLRRWI
ncbi:MAG: CorA family divalent cation transporter [Thermoleophilaceae bacterium]